MVANSSLAQLVQQATGNWVVVVARSSASPDSMALNNGDGCGFYSTDPGIYGWPDVGARVSWLHESVIDVSYCGWADLVTG